MAFARHAGTVVLLALALFCAGVWSVVYAESPRQRGVLTFAVLNVGQGDALYIESPTGVQLLIDGGPDDSLLRVLPEVMPALDRTLDAVVATHPDADHIGGFAELFARYDVGVYVTPGIPKDTAAARRLEEAVAEREIPRLLARRGMVLELGGGARLTVLYPDRDVSSLPSDEVNEGGVVAQLTYGETEVLLMADVGASVESRLVALDGEALQSDILKVGHHGSRYSTSARFVSVVAPTTAVISVGGNNSYGHPTPQALGVLKDAGASVLRTDQEGTIVCTSNAVAFTCN